MSQSPTTDFGAQGRGAALLAIATLAVALNVGLGATVFLLKLPVYVDAAGTLVVAMLAGRMGWRGLLLAMAVGAASFLIVGLTLNPAVLWFIGTQCAIAAYGYLVARPALASILQGDPIGWRGGVRIVLVGIGLGVVAGVVSAPVIAFVFGGVTGSGASFMTALLLKSGASLYKSVLASGLASEPLDKTVQVIVAVALVRATPLRVRRRFG